MPARMRALLAINGFGLLLLAVLVGWVWFFTLLRAVVLWPLPFDIPVNLPDDGRAWRMAHMEGITQGLMLVAIAFAGQFMQLTRRQFGWLFWSSLVTAWLFTVPTIFNALYGTRGLAFGGGPFKSGIENDVIYLFGWPPVLAVHIMLGLSLWGLWQHLRLR